jgi:signal transduction histidine kinase
MISTQLVQLIENNWEEIAKRVIRDMRQHPDMQNLARKADLELREWCREILEQLGVLMSARKDQEVQRRFEVLGKIRFEEKIPLHEAVLRFHILKDHIVRFIHERGFPMTAIQLYAEEELEQRMGRFFDECVYRVVRGYERALRLEQRVAS